MAKNIKTIEQDGFVYEQHDVAIDNGKTNIGQVLVPAPITKECFELMVEKGIDNWSEIAALYRIAKTIRLQAQARAAKKTGKMPQSEFNRIYNTILTTEQKQQPFDQVYKTAVDIYNEQTQ